MSTGEGVVPGPVKKGRFFSKETLRNKGTQTWGSSEGVRVEGTGRRCPDSRTKRVGTTLGTSLLYRTKLYL